MLSSQESVYSSRELSPATQQARPMYLKSGSSFGLEHSSLCRVPIDEFNEPSSEQVRPHICTNPMKDSDKTVFHFEEEELS